MDTPIKNVNLTDLRVRIVLTGGGTGGHIYPLLSVFRVLKKLAGQKLLNLEAVYIGPKDNFGDEAFSNEKIKIIKISAGKLRRYFSLANFFDIFKFVAGFLKSLYELWKFMPDLIFSKGGYGSVPVILAARVYRIPVFIHESDTVPGLSNKLAAKFAKRIAVSFDKTFEYFPKDKTALTGNPIREDLFGLVDKNVAKSNLGFDPQKSLVLVLGGSQGCQKINDLLLESLETLVTANIQILHQTGKVVFRQVAAEGKIILETLPDGYRSSYKAKGFLNENEYALALAACDLVVARAGSGTIFEISASKKPSILIPLPNSAGDHQRINAFEYARAGAAIVMEEGNILPDLLSNQIMELLNNSEKMNDLGNRANLFSQQNSAEKIANEIFDVLKLPL